jgi:hypothetical protein
MVSVETRRVSIICTDSTFKHKVDATLLAATLAATAVGGFVVLASINIVGHVRIG